MTDPKKPVTIESLLHLKRSERPPDEFWSQFESELRAKQLAAIVGPRPWWSGFTLRRFATLLPISCGAAAAAGIAIFSVHEIRGHRAGAVAAPVLAVAHSTPAALVAMPVALPAATPVAAVAPRPLPAPAASDAVTLERAPAPLVATATNASRAAFPDPFNGSIAALQPDSAQTVSLALGGAANGWSSNGVAARRAQAEPLTRTVTAADERRAVFLSNPFPGASAAFQTTSLSLDDHPASELSDERLYQAVRRLSAGGGRVYIRF